MNDIKDENPIDSLYNERERLIIIGLTGRTGAGCTTVSNILRKKDIKELDLRSYKTCDFNNSDERKYSVIYRFMKEGKRWHPFTVIEASSIIFSFILERTFGDLFHFLDSILQNSEGVEGGRVKIKLYNLLSETEINNLSEIDEDSLNIKLIDSRVKKYLDILSQSLDESNFSDFKEAINYFTNELVEKKAKFNRVLRYYSLKVGLDAEDANDSDIQEYNLYTLFMQEAANNIRSSGSFDDSNLNVGREITIARRIDVLIKGMIRFGEYGNSGKERIRICIDALRNSMEIQFFRDRYRAFYAYAVNTEDSFRQKRLGINKNELKGLDKIEYPEDHVFYHQNIQSCLEIADVYLYNPDISNHKYYELTEQLLKYIALTIHPGMIAPTHVERCMQLAFNAKYNSGCISRQVGAIVTGDDFSVRSVGWNDVPKGQVPCNLRCVEDFCRNKDTESFSDFELTDDLFDETLQRINSELDIKDGRRYSYCFKDIYNGLTGKNNQVHTRALHAEENAFLQIAKYGGAEIQGGKLFSTASPCELCSKKAYQLGIKEIYYIDPYPGISRTHILSFGRSQNPRMILFMGAIGNAYISLYSPKIPYKDELEVVTKMKSKTIAERIMKEHTKQK